MSSLKFFFDAFSQPSRAVLILLELGNIPYKPCLINLAKGENRLNKEFMEVSATRTVPAIDDNGLKLFESSAILRYLVNKYKLADHWYPSDPERQAKVEEYLSWHGTGMRLGAATFFFSTFFYPKISGNPPDPKRIQEAKTMLHKGLDLLDSHFLKDTKFINSDEVSIADIQAACEMTQFWMTDVDFLKERPKVKQWLDNVQAELNPSFDHAHKMVNLARTQGIFKSNL